MAESLKKLFVKELQDLYSAEKQIVKALPKMIKKANAPELKQAFQKHLTQTEEQVNRLEEVFKDLQEKAKARKCLGIEGLLNEGKEMMSEDLEPELLDVALIAAAQKVEHYEMAGYGCMNTWAEQLSLKNAAKLFSQTLEEEKQTDQRLTELATKVVNPKVASAA